MTDSDLKGIELSEISATCTILCLAKAYSDKGALKIELIKSQIIPVARYLLYYIDIGSKSIDYPVARYIIITPISCATKYQEKGPIIFTFTKGTKWNGSKNKMTYC